MGAAMQTVRRVILGLSVAAMVLCAWLAPQDSTAIQQTDAGLKRALLTFATARALNAVISVAQGTEVSVQPLGFGVNFTPGQLLDPINDLVEQFSNLMLLASVAFGVQKALVSIGAWWLISLALTAAALGWAWFRLRQSSTPVWLSGTLVVLLMVRFAVPAAIMGSDWLFQKFLATDYSASQQVIDTASGQIANLNAPVPDVSPNQSLLDQTRGWWPQNLDIKTRFENLRKAAEQAIEHIIRLIVIFLLQTLIIPLLLFWVLYRIARAAFAQTGAVVLASHAAAMAARP